MAPGLQRPQLTGFSQNKMICKDNVCAVARQSHNGGAAVIKCSLHPKGGWNCTISRFKMSGNKDLIKLIRTCCFNIQCQMVI